MPNDSKSDDDLAIAAAGTTGERFAGFTPVTREFWRDSARRVIDAFARRQAEGQGAPPPARRGRVAS